MPSYEYVALDSKGEETVGTLEAESDGDAISQLRRNGFYPTKVVEEGKGGSAGKRKVARTASRSKGKVKTGGKGGGKIKSKSLMLFTRQLATLIDSGLPLLRSLTVLSKQEPNPALKKTIGNLADSVQGGATFSESLAQYPRMFNKLFINMVKLIFANLLSGHKMLFYFV